MSFQEYADHISQKYRLAVAISVIKTKPKNLSIDEYLSQLQTKIKNEKFDPNETVCSDDFNFDDDDILEENKQDKQCVMLNENRLDYSVNENDNQGSQTILNDFVFEDGRLEVNMEGDTSIGDTLRLLKEVARVTEEEANANQNLSQLTFCESQETVSNANNEVTRRCYDTTNAIEDHKTLIQNGNENNCMDSQETQLYTLHGFTQDYTHVSQTQEDYFVIADKYIRNNATNSKHVQNNVDNVKDINEHFVLSQNMLAITVDGRENIEKIYVPQQVTETDYNAKPSQYIRNVTLSTANKSDKNDTVGPIKNINDVQIQNLVTTQDIEYNVNNEATDKFAANNDADKAIRNDNNYNNTFEMSGTKVNKGTGIGNGTPILSFDNQNTVTNESTVSNGLQNVGIVHKDSQEINKDITQNTQSLDIKNAQEDNDIIESNDMEIDQSESEENTQQSVPFKVIEELNKVKNFVNKKDKRYEGYSTDSGYRSDSQARSSLKTSSQLHGAWLNQSAHCLFNHILQATATDDIVKQIAQVLGKLIDKLHEEENYPQFLEELLETVDRMLLDMRVGGGRAGDVLITKDETIQRLLLLNKSKHILKYTIEKITNALEELHANLTREDLYELTNIVELENVCYIFHILETLLKRYMKVKDVSSQNTQNSQEDALPIPTRSSLTKLWRKKWYPNSNKEVIKNENKTCVLKGCSEILNKLIVECMDGYSLVAFAALQCFNLIQG